MIVEQDYREPCESNRRKAKDLQERVYCRIRRTWMTRVNGRTTYYASGQLGGWDEAATFVASKDPSVGEIRAPLESNEGRRGSKRTG